VASLSQGRTAAAQCGLFTHKSVPVIFEPPCMLSVDARSSQLIIFCFFNVRISFFLRSVPLNTVSENSLFGPLKYLTKSTDLFSC